MRIAAVLSSAFLAAAAGLCAADSETSPAPFPHQLHVEREGISCTDCHTRARGSDQATDDLVPLREACLECHSADDVPAPVPTGPRAVALRFSHRYHLEKMGLACERCHAGVTKGKSAAGALPDMASCMTCHNGAAAPRECETCHEAPRASLVPTSHQPGWAREHGRQARLSDTSCLPCHRTAQCQECHDGAMLTKLAGAGLRETPYTPADQSIVLKRVHGLNYRFLHSLEARGKSSDCLTCHELDAGDFCGQCHNPGGQLGVRPAWHGGAGWLTSGVNSGGGRHAELARRDLESCAACHEGQGQDPACLLCHMDRTPGKGNDPRTHARGFAADQGEGDFHDDRGASCFTCHVDQTGPNGFCSYCHESRAREDED